MHISPSLRANVETLLAAEAKRDRRPPPSTPAGAEQLTQPSASTLRTIGRHEIVRLLGRGGNAEVYLTYDPVLDRDVAVKLMRGAFDDAVAQARLELEARAAARLRHPNIVTIFDAGEHEGTPYIAMEYVPGETLRSIIRRQAELSLPRRLELIEGACAGLAHAHRAGVVHLDVKPDNLMLDESGVVKVLDFGIARVLRSEVPVTNHHVGTLRYMSPEQVSGALLDRRSDVFSLGCSLFELVTYSFAYPGSTHEMIVRIAEGPVPRLLDVVPEVDPRLDAIVSRAMALDPADRFEDLDDLRSELALSAARDGSRDRRAPPLAGGGAANARGRAAAGQIEEPRGAAAARPDGLARRRGRCWRLGSARSGLQDLDRRRAPRWRMRHASRAGGSVRLALRARRLELVRDDVWRRLAIGDRPAVLRLLRPGATNERTGSGPSTRIRGDRRRARHGASGARRGRRHTGDASLGRLSPGRRPVGTGEPPRGGAAASRCAWCALAGHGSLRPRDDVQSTATGTDRAWRDRVPEPVAQPMARLARVARLIRRWCRWIHRLPRPPLRSRRPRAPPPAANIARPAPAVPSDSEAIVSRASPVPRPRTKRSTSAACCRCFRRSRPTRSEQLRRTFAGMTSYEIEARQPRVNVASDVATVRAVVARRMVPRVGRPVENEVETEFHFRRGNSGWVITDVRAVAGQ